MRKRTQIGIIIAAWAAMTFGVSLVFSEVFREAPLTLEDVEEAPWEDQRVAWNKDTPDRHFGWPFLGKFGDEYNLGFYGGNDAVKGVYLPASGEKTPFTAPGHMFVKVSNGVGSKATHGLLRLGGKSDLLRMHEEGTHSVEAELIFDDFTGEFFKEKAEGFRATGSPNWEWISLGGIVSNETNNDGAPDSAVGYFAILNEDGGLYKGTFDFDQVTVGFPKP